jgi:hypothetical protein
MVHVFGHAMSKVAQCAITNDKVSKGFDASEHQICSNISLILQNMAKKHVNNPCFYHIISIYKL